MKTIVIGTRGSKLALWQAHWIEKQLHARDIPTRIEIIKTAGDKITDVPLAKVGAQSGGLKGVFTKEIEEALIAGNIDVAVHSLKDLPTEIDERLAVSAIPKRADARDSIAGNKLGALSEGAKVGTSSLRRTAQLRHLRPDLRVENIRGNVDTRLRKLDEGQYDAVILASAGLKRLGFEERAAEILDPEVMVPAVGQGALGIETRADDKKVNDLLGPLNDPETEGAAKAERALLAALGGGCQVPMGAHATRNGSGLRLVAVVVSQDGKDFVRADVAGDPSRPEDLGRETAERLISQGAAKIIEAAELNTS